MSENVQIPAGKKKLTHADNDIYGIIERYPWPVRVSFIKSSVKYTEEQVDTSINKLVTADMIELVDESAKTYQIKIHEVKAELNHIDPNTKTACFVIKDLEE